MKDFWKILFWIAVVAVVEILLVVMWARSWGLQPATSVQLTSGSLQGSTSQVQSAVVPLQEPVDVQPNYGL